MYLSMYVYDGAPLGKSLFMNVFQPEGLIIYIPWHTFLRKGTGSSL